MVGHDVEMWQHITPPFKVTALRSAMRTTACSFCRTQPMPTANSRTINQCVRLGHLRSPTGSSCHTFFIWTTYKAQALCANKLLLTTCVFGHRAILISGGSRRGWGVLSRTHSKSYIGDPWRLDWQFSWLVDTHIFCLEPSDVASSSVSQANSLCVLGEVTCARLIPWRWNDA